MKILLLLLSPFILFGCTKKKLEKFNNRIIGNWQLVEVTTFGVGSSNIIFDGGSFIFKSDNTTTYYDRNNNTYFGSWYIDAYVTNDDEGNTETDFILSVDVSNNTNSKFDQFEIPHFGNANRFKAKVRNNLNVVTYTFQRQ